MDNKCQLCCQVIPHRKENAGILAAAITAQLVQHVEHTKVARVNRLTVILTHFVCTHQVTLQAFNARLPTVAMPQAQLEWLCHSTYRFVLDELNTVQACSVSLICNQARILKGIVIATSTQETHSLGHDSGVMLQAEPD